MSFTDYYSWRWQKRPQFISMKSGVMIFISGGMNLALGLGWNLVTHIPNSLHFQISWFIGVILGVLVAMPLIKFLPKRLYMLLGAILVFADGVIFICKPLDYLAILIARYLNGIAIGFIVIPFLVHGSELAMQSYRGTCLASEQLGMSLGIAVQVISSAFWRYNIAFPANRLHGIYDVILGVIAFTLVFFIIESPLFYLRNADEDEALECIKCLEKPPLDLNIAVVLLEEHKCFLFECERLSLWDSFIQNLGPLLKMLFYRSMVAFSFSLPLSQVISVASFIAITSGDFNFAPLLFALLRAFASLITIPLIDRDRKILPLLSLITMGGLIIGIGVIFSDSFNVLNSKKMLIVCILAMLYQFFAGYFAPSTSVYLGEAFSLTLKPYLIGICVIMEQLIHIIVICIFYNERSYRFIYIYCITVGIIVCVSMTAFSLTMPVTKNTSLSEAQSRFRRIFNIFYLYKCN